jgi:hypothetical protein
MTFTPHPSSLAMKSAQWMTDARELDRMLTEMEKRRDKRATPDEKQRLTAIMRRMPADMQRGLGPVAKKLGIEL